MKNKNNYSKAKELRAQAKDRLKNRWGVAIFAFVIALLMGAVGSTLSFTMTEDISYITRTSTSTETIYVEDVGYYGDEEIVDDFTYEGPLYMMDEDHEEYIQDMVDSLIIIGLLVLIVAVVIVYCFLYTLFVAAPMQTGYMRFNLDLFKTRKEVSVNRLLYGFKNGYSRSVGACFRVGLIYIGVALRFFLTGVALMIVCGLLPADLFWIGLIVLLVIYFMWVIANIKVALTYSMCYYLLADHPDMTGGEALKASKEMMNGQKWRLLRLRLSFLGWIFLSAMTLGIGLIWVGPYMQAADTAFYRELAKGGKKQSFLAGLFQGA